MYKQLAINLERALNLLKQEEKIEFEELTPEKRQEFYNLLTHKLPFVYYAGEGGAESHYYFEEMDVGISFISHETPGDFDFTEKIDEIDVYITDKQFSNCKEELQLLLNKLK